MAHAQPEDVHVEEHHGLDREEPTEKKEFTKATGFTTAEAEALLKIHGRNELVEITVPKWLIFLRLLKGPMPIMIWIAIIVEFAIQNYIDGGILLGIQFTNAFISYYETTKAGDAVAALKASLKPLATCKRDGKWQNMDAGALVPGDLVLLASGSAVPADCLVNEGQIDVDQAALTGESLPVTMYEGDSCKMGSTVVRGEVEGTVEFTGGNTFFGKTASMLQMNDGELGNLQKILLSIMIVLVGVSLVLCIIVLAYTLSEGEPIREALSFVVVLIVASIPMAIEIVSTTTLALGSRALSVHGAIVTRLIAIEEMAGMNMLCSDKTGTLTLNKMVIQEDTPVFVEGLDQAQLLVYAALAAKWREPPRDALDTLVLTVADLSKCDVYTQLEFMPFDPTIKRTEGTLKGPDGKVFKITKGAPHVISKLVTVDAERIHKAVDAKVLELGKRGIRSLAVAKSTDDGGWQFLGILTFLDPPRPDTKETIHRAMAFGVDVKMITGDHGVIAKETARMLGMGTNIQGAEALPTMPADGKIPKDLYQKYGDLILNADGFAQVYPEHKYLIVETLRQGGFATGMTGDGVNDAPALKKADVGIAVQGATDAARAAADIVLTEPGLSVVVEAIIIARKIFQRINSFISYRVAATLQLLVFFFIAVLALQPHKYEHPHHERWPEFFSLPVLMLMLITLLNDGTLISIGYDNVKSSPRPCKWNLKATFLIASTLGAVAMVSSLVLLHFALDSHNPNGLFARWNLPPMEYGKIINMMYMKVSLSDFLTLFSSRTIGPFWESMPSPVLIGAGLVSLAISTILASVWPKGLLDNLPVCGLALDGDYSYRLWPLWIWIYCIIWWWIQDACKVACLKLIVRFDLFGYVSGAAINARGVTQLDDQPTTSLARQSVGMVETKLLNMKVEDALQRVSMMAQQAPEKALARVSVEMQLARTSIRAAHGSATVVPDVDQAVEAAEQAISRVEQATNEVSDSSYRAELESHLAGIRQTAEDLKAASAALHRGH